MKVYHHAMKMIDGMKYAFLTLALNGTKE